MQGTILRDRSSLCVMISGILCVACKRLAMPTRAAHLLRFDFSCLVAVLLVATCTNPLRVTPLSTGGMANADGAVRNRSKIDFLG